MRRAADTSCGNGTRPARSSVKVYEEVRRLGLPKAHFEMARALERRWSIVTKFSPAIACGILRDVAGYEIVGVDPQSRKNKKRLLNSNPDADIIDTRLQALLDTQDPSIILDRSTTAAQGREGPYTIGTDGEGNLGYRRMLSEYA